MSLPVRVNVTGPTYVFFIDYVQHVLVKKKDVGPTTLFKIDEFNMKQMTFKFKTKTYRLWSIVCLLLYHGCKYQEAH